MTTPVPPPPSRAPTFLRPVLGLLAALGIMVVVVVAGTFMATIIFMRGSGAGPFKWTTAFALVNLTFATLGALAGGFTASRITRGHTLYTVYLLAVVTAVSGAVPVLKRLPPANGQPGWYALAIAIFVPLGVLIGGTLERRKSSQAEQHERSLLDSPSASVQD